MLRAWHTGLGRGWPFLPQEESLFRCQLPDPAAGYRWRRSDVTTLMVALREGTHPWQLSAFLPGWDRVAAAAVYDYVQARLDHAADMWYRFVQDPCTATLTAVVHDTEPVLPVPVAALTDTVARPHAGVSLADAAAQAAARVAAAADRVDQLETQMGHAAVYDRVSAAFYGAWLYHPRQPCAYSEPYFLPQRLAHLTPTRLARILGETQLGQHRRAHV